MKLRNKNRIRVSRLTKRQKQEFYENIEQEFSNLDEEDMKKLEFARDLMNELQLIFDTDDITRIQIGPIDAKAFEYFIVIILMEYESLFWKP
jgi:hypothetical protein